MYLENLKEQIKKLSQLRNLSDRHKSCRIEEIHQLEQELNLLLPESLTEFLLWIGNGSWYFDQDNCRISDMIKNHRRAIQIMATGNSVDQLPKNSIIFICHQGGDAFAFVRSSEGEDPPVHFYQDMENSDRIRWNHANTIEDYFLRDVVQLIKTYENSP